MNSNAQLLHESKMVNRNCRLLATWESVAKHLIDGALQHAEQCLQKNYLRWMKLLGHANCFGNVKPRLIKKKAASYFAKMP